VPATKARQFALSRHTHDFTDLGGSIDWNTQLDNIPSYVSSLANFNEAVDDRVGALFVDSSEIDFSYNDGGDTVSASLLAASVTFSKLQNVATARIMGRTTSGSGSIESLTGTQATALLDTFTTALKGLAPASGGGTANFLRADGTWAAPAGGGTGANPTASVGLTAVNGSALTFLRSDGAPALDQAISPTWTGTHRYSGTSPFVGFIETDQGSNEKRWAYYVGGKTFNFATLSDDEASVRNQLVFTRGTGLALSGITYGSSTDNPVHTFNGGVRMSSGFQAQNHFIPAAGVGVEVSYVPASNFGYVLAYNRDTATYKDLVVAGSSVLVAVNGTDVVKFNGSPGNGGSTLTLGTTAASLPSGSTAAQFVRQWIPVLVAGVQYHIPAYGP
jgi:hypothetical protein